MSSTRRRRWTGSTRRWIASRAKSASNDRPTSFRRTRSSRGDEALPRRASPAAQEHAARQAGIRTVARRERPVYRVLPAVDGRWYVFGYPWVSIDARGRRSALDSTRAAVAMWLGV